MAGVLSGAVAGDHVSPISDTTILSSLACECQLLAHTVTQAPYALIVVIWSVLVGTIPSGMGAFPNGVSIFLGFLAMVFHVIFTSEFIINKTGRYDIFTELYIRFIKNKEFYISLKADVVEAFETGMPVPLPEGRKMTTVEDQSENPQRLDDTASFDKGGQEVVNAKKYEDNKRMRMMSHDEPVDKMGDEEGSGASHA